MIVTRFQFFLELLDAIPHRIVEINDDVELFVETRHPGLDLRSFRQELVNAPSFDLFGNIDKPGVLHFATGYGGRDAERLHVLGRPPILRPAFAQIFGFDFFGCV